jgi:hypothetical protein
VKPHARTLILLAAFAAPAALAQGAADYALNDGKVRFRVPPTWTAVMEKRDGNPQAVAFQVPDAAAAGSEDSATVTVKTRQLAGSAAFAGIVQEELDRSKAQAGYENDSSNKDTSVHQYFVTRGKTRYLVRDSFYLTGDVAAEVRCQRPLLAATSAAWNDEFDRACNGVVASLKQ